MRVQPPTGDDLPPEFPCPNAHLPPPSSGGSVDDGHHHTHGVSAALQAIMGRSPGRSQPHVQQDGHAGHTYSLWVTRGSNRIGRVYKKAVYREYTDATFTRRKERGPDEVHLGALGPVIRAEVGDTIKVVFRNNVSFPCSIHAHGVFYRKADEGHGYSDGHSSPGDSVAPGQVYTYTWEVPERAGPGPNDMSSILWLYHSHVNEMTDTNAGLFGPIVITRKGYAKPDGSPIDVDREFFTSLTVYDENSSPYLEWNKQHFLNESADSGHSGHDTEDSASTFEDSNLKYAVNGYLYGSIPGLYMYQGERVRWYLFGLGSEEGLHTAHWHGVTLLENGHRVDVVELLPASFRVADMTPDNPGFWMFHCHVNHHIHGGMTALFEIRPGEVHHSSTGDKKLPSWIWAVIGVGAAVPILGIALCLIRGRSEKDKLRSGADRVPTSREADEGTVAVLSSAVDDPERHRLTAPAPAATYSVTAVTLQPAPSSDELTPVLTSGRDSPPVVVGL